MANNQKKSEINQNSSNNSFIPLEEIETILNQILTKETISEIIKVS